MADGVFGTCDVKPRIYCCSVEQTIAKFLVGEYDYVHTESQVGSFFVIGFDAKDSDSQYESCFSLSDYSLRINTTITYLFSATCPPFKSSLLRFLMFLLLFRYCYNSTPSMFKVSSIVCNF